MMNWMYYTYFGSGIIDTNKIGVNNCLSLSKDNCENPALHVPKENIKIEELGKCGRWLNRYKQLSC